MMIEDFIIGNVHGLWQGSIKTDTEAKIEQSKNIIDLVEMVKGRKIICGDFNMLPDTKSIQILGDKYRDLIKEHNVKNTRSSLYVKDLRYSDYIFTDRDIKIKDFSVANQEISDHLPLCLEFTLK
jgi:endonuclease/exonuclease/phosphatase family metal-dependent hydrolase